ncbi:MAG TPA: exosortase K [Thermoanaerobaculia bacterium]|nr:exosortase K [Thermoanaerobaculia bacterium]
MRRLGDGQRLRNRPWMSWGMAVLAAYALKLHYSRASAEDLAWILVPTARAVGWLRGETLSLSPGAGWVAPDGSYVIAPACAGVNFMILGLTVSVLGFAHRLRSPGSRLSWWLASLGGAYVLTIAVNTLRILAAVELYRLDPVAWLTPEQGHRLLGAALYLAALWGVFAVLDGLTAQGRAGARSMLVAAVLVPGAYLGMTVVVPLLNGASRRPGGQYVEHAMMVSLVALAPAGALALLFLARRVATKMREKT